MGKHNENKATTKSTTTYSRGCSSSTGQIKPASQRLRHLERPAVLGRDDAAVPAHGVEEHAGPRSLVRQNAAHRRKTASGSSAALVAAATTAATAAAAAAAAATACPARTRARNCAIGRSCHHRFRRCRVAARMAVVPQKEASSRTLALHHKGDSPPQLLAVLNLRASVQWQLVS